MSLADLIEGRRLVVCVGPGGVGKTTVSAALGVMAARAGRRVFVLTIDPARRLADALALDGLDDTTRRVPLERLPEGAPSGELCAAMVDTGVSFDALIERIAEDDATRDRIFANPVYQVISRSLARSHAYVAMERLHHAMTAESHDLVILDTPPARNAIDILDAPRQLARFLDAKIVDWLLPGGGVKTGLAGLLARGGQVAVSLLRRVTGPELLDGIIEFLGVFADLRPGFVQRAEAVDRTLHDASTAYLLVASGSPSAIDDAAWLRDDLRRRDIDIDAVVCNASYLPVDPADPRRIVSAIPALGAGDVPTALSARADLLGRLRALRIEAASVNAEAQTFVDGFAAELPPRTPIVRTPRFAEEVRDLPALARLADYLRDPGRAG